MTFVPLVWPVLVAVLLLWGLGGFLSWAVGLRGLWAFAAAPAFALTLIGGTAVVASWLGIPWTAVPVIGMTLLIGAAIFSLRRIARMGAPRRRRPQWWLVGALVAAGAVVTFRVLQIVQDPSHISQTFDNIFHLNGVRWVLTQGDASSLTLGYMTSPDGSLPFYPAAWHGLVSLVVQASGATIPVAINAATVVIAAVIWPAGAVLLVRTLFGRSVPITVSAALLATALPGFPILPMDYGVLYPMQLSLALLPVALAATVRLLKIAPGGSPRPTWWWILILVGIIPALTLAHPGGFVAWLALSAPMVAVAVVQAVRAATSVRARALVLAAALAYLVIGVVLVRVLRPPLEARLWPAQMSIADAAWQVLSISVWYLAPAVVAAVCVVVGVVWAIVDHTPRAVVALLMYLVGAGLFVTVAAIDLWSVRDFLTGSWYNNLPRLAAILAVALVPIGAYGAGRTWIAIVSRPRVRHVTRAWRRSGRGVVAVLGSALLLIALQSDGAMARAVDWASPLYRLDDSSSLLTTDEYALLERVADHVPEGVVIAGSPWTGASLAAAISDRPVLMPHTLMQISDDLETVNEGLGNAADVDAVCEAVSELGVGYALDFGRQEVHPGEHPMPGLDDLATSSAVELVDQEGEAKLYRVTACG